jgi:hypothetical protein
MESQAQDLLNEVKDGVNKLANEACSIDNMHLWNQVCKTDPAITHEIKLGKRKITSICAQSQRKRATELWGPYGQNWGVNNQKFTIIDVQLSNESKVCLYEAILYYPGGNFPITSSIEVLKEKEIWIGGQGTGKYRNVYNEDWAKKVSTDALTKGLSFIGFNADVFEGKFDDSKYVNELKKEKKSIPEQKINNESKTNVENVVQVFDAPKQDQVLWLYYEQCTDIELKNKINEHLNGDKSEKAKDAFIKMLDSREFDVNGRKARLNYGCTFKSS